MFYFSQNDVISEWELAKFVFNWIQSQTSSAIWSSQVSKQLHFFFVIYSAFLFNLPMSGNLTVVFVSVTLYNNILVVF
jgi:hypothetical protein